MDLAEIFLDKSVKAKARVSQIGDWVLTGKLPVDELLSFAESQTPANRAACIEAIEYATKTKPEIADETLLMYLTKALKEDEPRVKWESARVIGNIAKNFPDHLKKSVENLLGNAGHSGTVVRWATAFALAEILKIKTGLNKTLLPKLEELSLHETDNGVKKKYLDAIKKVKK